MRCASLALAGTGLIAAAIATPGGAAAPAGHAAATCTRATNIEAIIDDSGSMSTSDPNRLRVRSLDLLINSLSPGTFLGAVEFGDSGDPSVPSADTVFKPEPVGPNATAMGTALDQQINADNGATDYNAAFAQSDADNPNAQARIFLTDGGHNEGTYNNGHLARKSPTYVVGFSPGLAAPEDQARLAQIASDTGGHYYPLTDSSELQSVMTEIETALTCQTPPTTFTDQLAQGQRKQHKLAISAGTKSTQIVATWAHPEDKFAISGLRLVRHGKTIATSARKIPKLKIKRTVSSTFELLKVSGLRKGTLRFQVKTLAVGSGQPRVTLTTQVSQSRSK